MNDSELYFKAYQDGLSMRTSFMYVTPEMAAEWLAKNTRNRNLRAKGAAVYASEIREGRWQVIHQGVAFDVSERLVDGQHRLQAIVDTGIAVPLNVTFGLPRGSMEAVDRGIMRSVPDVLRLEHAMDNSARITALVGVLAPAVESYYLKLTPGYTLHLARQWNPQIDWAMSLPQKGRLWKAPIVAAFMIAHRTCREEIEGHVAQYRDMEGLVGGMPVHYLRTQLLEHNRDYQLAGPALTRWVCAVLRKAVMGETIPERGGVRNDDERGLEFFRREEGGAS